MSENEVSLQQKVVITRNGALFYLDLERAAKVEALLLSPSKPDYVEIDGTLIQAREITMVAPTAKVEEMNRRKKGDWQCERGHWHTRDETVCKQGWGTGGVSKERPKDPELTPLQKARGELVKSLMDDDGKSLAEAIKIARIQYPTPKEEAKTA